MEITYEKKKQSIILKNLQDKSLIRLAYQIKDYIKKNHGKCKILVAPTDICLTQKNSNKPTIVQPDILIVCDKEKETQKRIEGAPDFIAEILSPASHSRDNILKLNKYREVGVPLHIFDSLSIDLSEYIK